jgi:hypothetical protein
MYVVHSVATVLIDRIVSLTSSVVVMAQGVAFVSTADIDDGDELFLNYRYNPDNTLPDWYTPVDIDSDREMWK